MDFETQAFLRAYGKLLLNCGVFHDFQMSLGGLKDQIASLPDDSVTKSLLPVIEKTYNVPELFDMLFNDKSSNYQ